MDFNNYLIKGCRGACKHKKAQKSCKATSTTSTESELIAKQELESVLNNVGVDKKDQQCGCDDLIPPDDIEEVKLKLKNTIKDMRILHMEITRLESKTTAKLPPGPNATPNAKILYRQIMKDESIFDDLEKPCAAVFFYN